MQTQLLTWSSFQPKQINLMKPQHHSWKILTDSHLRTTSSQCSRATTRWFIVAIDASRSLFGSVFQALSVYPITEDVSWSWSRGRNIWLFIATNCVVHLWCADATILKASGRFQRTWQHKITETWLNKISTVVCNTGSSATKWIQCDMRTTD